MFSKTKKAFTLVEIMIVVVIICLLAVMAIPAYSRIKKQDKEKIILNNLRQIATAGQQYILENGVYQVGFDALNGVYFTTINPVSGESYSGITIIEGGGAIATTTTSGNTITFSY